MSQIKVDVVRPFKFEIMCRSGALKRGASNDFLVCLMKAIEAKRSAKILMPSSTLILRVFYPNGSRVPTGDLRASFTALQNTHVYDLVSSRLAVRTPKSACPQRSEDSRFLVSESAFFAAGFVGAFCQASVVAPPDSPTDGNLPCPKPFNS